LAGLLDVLAQAVSQQVGSQQRRLRHRRSSNRQLLGAHGSLQESVSQQVVWQHVNRAQHRLKQLLRQQRDSQQLVGQHVVQHFVSQQLGAGQHGAGSETTHGTMRHFLTHTV
jgi:hypothetical protein